MSNRILIVLLLIALKFMSFGQSEVRQIDRNALDFNWLDNYVQAFHNQKGISGSLLIANNQSILYQTAIGWENVQMNVDARIHTKFNLGSGNKMFTAVAIAQLVEKGVLGYDDFIIEFLPDYPNQAFAQNATIHHLLTHTSGLGDYWDDEYEKYWHQIKTLQDKLPFILNKKPLFKPGEGRRYSNSGYVLLGLIIERVSGLSYFEYIRHNIYQLAGMSNTDCYPNDGSIKGLATPYRGNGLRWYVADQGLKGSSDGGGYSTILDMYNFHLALQSNLLISKASLNELQTDKTPPNQEVKWEYGYGFVIEQINGLKAIGHGGTGYGTYFNFRYFPEKGYFVVLFSNSENAGPEILFEAISNYLTSSYDERNQFVQSIPGSTNIGSPQIELGGPPSESLEILVLDSSSSQEDQRYLNIVSIVLACFEDQDFESFHGLFEKQDIVTRSSNQSMFSFALEALTIRGEISGFHALGPPIRIPDSSYPVRSAIFHFEDGKPGVLIFSLNDDDIIDHFSFFVHSRACEHGQHPDCKLISIPADVLTKK